MDTVWKTNGVKRVDCCPYCTLAFCSVISISTQGLITLPHYTMSAAPGSGSQRHAPARCLPQAPALWASSSSSPFLFLLVLVLILPLLPSGPTGKQAAQITSIFNLVLFCSLTIVEQFWKGGSASVASMRRLETMAVVLVISRCKSWLLLMVSALLFLVLLSNWISLTVKTEDVQRYSAGIVWEWFG